MIESAFRAGDTARAEKLVLDFSDKGTPHAFWLAKSFLVLGDIYVQKGDMFQARATYQSIVDGYTPPMTESLRKRKRKSRNSINDMKRSAILSLMFIAGMLAVPGVLNAQVEKRVEVSKAYVPSVEHATKLAVRPNMVDTAAIQPEIDYSITPLTLETQARHAPDPSCDDHLLGVRPSAAFLPEGRSGLSAQFGARSVCIDTEPRHRLCVGLYQPRRTVRTDSLYARRGP